MLNYDLDSYAIITLISRLRRALLNFRSSFRDIITNLILKRLITLTRNRLYINDII